MDKVKVLHYAKELVQLELRFNRVVDSMLEEIGLTRKEVHDGLDTNISKRGEMDTTGTIASGGVLPDSNDNSK